LTTALPKGFDPKRYQFSKGFPTRENCNLDDPREMFLWMLAALPGVRGAQLVMPVSYNMVISEHLHECGARLAAAPVKKYQPPTATDPHWLTSPGQWVPLDTPDVVPNPARAVIGQLTSMQKAELLKVLLEEQAEGDGD
jgi:hypothetical protein